MKITYATYQLPFRHPFTISRGTKSHQPTLIVQLEHFGMFGLGEAPAITYYNIPLEKMVEDLERKKSFIENYKFSDPERFWHFLHHLFPNNSFLVCALDIAGWDLYGKMSKMSLQDCWKLTGKKGPLTDYTIGIDTPELMLKKMQEKPWPVYKIKVGSDHDIDTIKTLRASTNAIIRVDANSGWKVDEAADKIQALAQLDVELVEQPLPKELINEMKGLYANSPLPLIADESCVGEQDVERCVGSFHGINIKLTKCGGLTPARRMIAQARKLNLKVMIGSMNESSIGSAALAHLLPLVDYADIDGPLLLEQDLATGLTFKNGEVIISKEPGLGIKPISNFRF